MKKSFGRIAILILLSVCICFMASCGEDNSNAEEAKVTAFIAATELLPSVAKVTLSDEDKITDAESKYDLLSDVSKELDNVFDAKRKLDSVRAKFDQLKTDDENKKAAEAVILAFLDLIGELPDTVETMTVADNIKVDAALLEWAALTNSAKADARVIAAKAKLDALKSGYQQVVDRETAEEAEPYLSAFELLPQLSALTLADKAALDAAEALYGELSELAKTNSSVVAAKTAIDALIVKYAELKAEDDKAILDADAFIAKVEAIGEVEYTDACVEKIGQAKQSYDGLSALALTKTGVTEAKTLLDAKLLALQVLIDAAVAEAIAPFLTAVDNIGEVQYTTECLNLIEAAEAEYDKLTSAEKLATDAVAAKSTLDDKRADYNLLHQEYLELQAEIEAYLSAVAALPVPSLVTLNDKAIMDAATLLNDNLSEKALLDDRVIQVQATYKLVKAAYDELVAEFNKTPLTDITNIAIGTYADGDFAGKPKIIDLNAGWGAFVGEVINLVKTKYPSATDDAIANNVNIVFYVYRSSNNFEVGKLTKKLRTPDTNLFPSYVEIYELFENEFVDDADKQISIYFKARLELAAGSAYRQEMRMSQTISPNSEAIIITKYIKILPTTDALGGQGLFRINAGNRAFEIARVSVGGTAILLHEEVSHILVNIYSADNAEAVIGSFKVIAKDNKVYFVYGDNVEITYPTLANVADAYLEVANSAMFLKEVLGVSYDEYAKYVFNSKAIATGTGYWQDSATTDITSVWFESIHPSVAAANKFIDNVTKFGAVEYSDVCLNKLLILEAEYAALTEQSLAVDGVTAAAELLTGYRTSFNSLESGKINAFINSVEAIGSVTEDSLSLIAAARSSYAELLASTIIKEDVVLAKAALTQAEEDYAALDANYEENIKITAFIASVDAIGTVAYTKECKALLDAAYAKYALLSLESQTSNQSVINNYTKLNAANAEYEDLKANAPKTKLPSLSTRNVRFNNMEAGYLVDFDWDAYNGEIKTLLGLGDIVEATNDLRWAYRIYNAADDSLIDSLYKNIGFYNICLPTPTEVYTKLAYYFLSSETSSVEIYITLTLELTTDSIYAADYENTDPQKTSGNLTVNKIANPLPGGDSAGSKVFGIAGNGAFEIGRTQLDGKWLMESEHVEKIEVKIFASNDTATVLATFDIKMIGTDVKMVDSLGNQYALEGEVNNLFTLRVQAFLQQVLGDTYNNADITGFIFKAQAIASQGSIYDNGDIVTTGEWVKP